MKDFTVAVLIYLPDRTLAWVTAISRDKAVGFPTRALARRWMRTHYYTFLGLALIHPDGQAEPPVGVSYQCTPSATIQPPKAKMWKANERVRERVHKSLGVPSQAPKENLPPLPYPLKEAGTYGRVSGDHRRQRTHQG